MALQNGMAVAGNGNGCSVRMCSENWVLKGGWGQLIRGKRIGSDDRIRGKGLG